MPRSRVVAVLPLAALCGLLATAVVPPMVRADNLGRLFYTPEQRAELDKARFAPKKKVEPRPEAAEVTEAEPPPPVQAFRMEGLVVRRQGPNTAWVDGFQVLGKGRTFQGIAVDPSAAGRGGMAVRVPGGDGVVDLKPGQTFDPETAQVSELVTRGVPAAAAPSAGHGNGSPQTATGSAGPETGAPQ